MKDLVEKFLITCDHKEEDTNEACIHKDVSEAKDHPMIDFSKVYKSDQYLEMVSHQIPIADLYKIIMTISHSE